MIWGELGTALGITAIIYLVLIAKWLTNDIEALKKEIEELKKTKY